MIAVADTSPISALIRVGRLSILGHLFQQVLIPPEVAVELDDGSEFFGDWRKVGGADRISTRGPVDQLMVRELTATLHLGEAAAVTLAAETSGSLLIIDESQGRKVAERLGLRRTGTLGLIIAAKRQGHIEAVAPVIDDLRTRARLWLSDELVQHALKLAGEQP